MARDESSASDAHDIRGRHFALTNIPYKSRTRQHVSAIENKFKFKKRMRLAIFSQPSSLFIHHTFVFGREDHCDVPPNPSLVHVSTPKFRGNRHMIIKTDAVTFAFTFVGGCSRQQVKTRSESAIFSVQPMVIR